MTSLTDIPPSILQMVFTYLDQEPFMNLAWGSPEFATMANQTPCCFLVCLHTQTILSGGPKPEDRFHNIEIYQPSQSSCNEREKWMAALLEQKSCQWVKYVRSMSIRQCLEWYPPNVRSMNIELWIEREKCLPADNLPKTLRSLFLQEYDQPLYPRVLPPGLQILEFKHVFNQPLEVGVLPRTLQRLSLGDSFDQPLRPYVLPDSLQELDLGWEFNHPLEPNALPPNLRDLRFSTFYDQPIGLNVLPPKLQTLFIGDGFSLLLQPGVLPQSLLVLHWCLGETQDLTPDTVPQNLILLRLTTMVAPTGRLEYLPQSLRFLRLGPGMRNKLQPKMLPNNLEVLQVAFVGGMPPEFAARAKHAISGFDENDTAMKLLSQEYPDLPKRLERMRFFD